MKSHRSLLILLLFGVLVSGCGVLGGGVANSRVQYSQYLGGYWGQWKTFTEWGFLGQPNSFVVYRGRDQHPSDFCFRITVNNFASNYLPKGEKRSYSGSIEYSLNNNDSNATRNGHYSRWFVENDLPYLSHHYYTKTRPASIVIEKKGKLYYYNVFFDDVGFAITIPWKD